MNCTSLMIMPASRADSVDVGFEHYLKSSTASDYHNDCYYLVIIRVPDNHEVLHVIVMAAGCADATRITKGTQHVSQNHLSFITRHLPPRTHK